MSVGHEERIAQLLIGESDAMVALRRMILQFAPTQIPVLLVGPTGAGKELVASALHLASGRSGAFVAFNVCAVGDNMLEDALFGHVRGAFTGAISNSLGYLREADRGTVLLDEIGGLSIPAQMKLLRAIENGVFRPVGASRDQRSDFRLIAATNENLEALTRTGRFRVDLLHRVGGLVLRVPPLSDRLDDIPLLVRHFTRGEKSRAVRFHPDAMHRLKCHSWPGNVRELRRVVERAVVLAGDGGVGTELVQRALAPVRSSSPPKAGPSARQQLLQLLEAANWDADCAARQLGIHRATLYRRLHRYGIDLRLHRVDDVA